MGNCFTTTNSNNSTSDKIAPYDFIKSTASTTAVTLYGTAASPLTAYLRVALLYKPSLSLHFVPSDTPGSLPVLQIGSQSFSGSREMMLKFADGKFPVPQLAAVEQGEGERAAAGGMVSLVVLQHRSMMWHLARVVRWAEDLKTRGGKRTVVMDPAVGSIKMEVGKFGKSYSQLLELLLDHARMEERVVFPIFDLADRGLCKAANEEHARDLPIMNGIKEDIKAIGVMNTGSPNYQEALCNLSARLKSLQKNCKEHFEEEERDVLPLMEAMELSKEQQMKVLEQCFDVMQATHSHLFIYFIEGLLPREAMQYLDLIMSSKDEEWQASMLHRIIE